MKSGIDGSYILTLSDPCRRDEDGPSWACAPILATKAHAKTLTLRRFILIVFFAGGLRCFIQEGGVVRNGGGLDVNFFGFLLILVRWSKENTLHSDFVEFPVWDIQSSFVGFEICSFAAQRPPPDRGWTIDNNG